MKILKDIAKVGCLGFFAITTLIVAAAMFSTGPTEPVLQDDIVVLPLAEGEPTATTIIPAPTLIIREIAPPPTPVPGVLPTDTPAPAIATDTPMPEPTATPAVPIANASANLRSGPGTEYDVVGSAQQGQAIDIVAKNGIGDWYQLEGGKWIAAFLVDNAPSALPLVEVVPPVVQPTQTPAVVVVQPAATLVAPAVAPQGDSQPFTCIGGCATPPDPSCAIKGNVNNSGERIYHFPGGQFYSRTDIKPEEGDRWFCTADEAQATGFRASQR